MDLTREEVRLREARAGSPWRFLGPYLSERQWGTVREDYSDDGDAWSYFTHDQARSRAYRWGLHKYPQAEFPYGDLVTTNQARGHQGRPGRRPDRDHRPQPGARCGTACAPDAVVPAHLVLGRQCGGPEPVPHAERDSGRSRGTRHPPALL